jgi:hypothetical protein
VCYCLSYLASARHSHSHHLLRGHISSFEPTEPTGTRSFSLASNTTKEHAAATQLLTTPDGRTCIALRDPASHRLSQVSRPLLPPPRSNYFRACCKLNILARRHKTASRGHPSLASATRQAVRSCCPHVKSGKSLARVCLQWRLFVSQLSIRLDDLCPTQPTRAAQNVQTLAC